ncbi:MAG: hypothetical protein CUN55_06495 [Phototrophicales bacterium]|nr:MAG: hypothetical protein CUN55_06495 [Phototrophicales bacterium]
MDNIDFLTALELDHLRNEALMRYEQCLTDRGTASLASFIEEQLTYTPPPLYLLEKIAHDLQQRLSTLQLHQHEVRNNIIHVMRENYDIDITSLVPADKIAYFHCISPDEICSNLPIELPNEERLLLRETLEASQRLAAQLQTDIDITHELVKMIVEWTAAISTRYARESHNWHFGINANFSEDIIH